MGKKELSYEIIGEICHKLALFTRAGVYHGEGLAVLAEEETDKDMSMLFTRMKRQGDQGLPLSACLESEQKFPNYMIGMIKAAEETGYLEKTLWQLSQHYYNKAQREKQIRAAITYPLTILMVMVVVIGVLLIKVLPIFDQVYQSLGSGLDGVAKGLLSLGQILEQLLPVLFVLLCVVIVFFLLYVKAEGFKYRIDGLFIKKWGDEGLAKEMNNVHFLQGLAMALSSGLNVEEGISLAGMMLKDIPKAEMRCQNCNKRIQEGIGLEKALEEEDFLSPSKAKLFALAQKVGKGDETLFQLAQQLSDETEERLANKVERIEPTLVIIAAVLIGFILLTVMLPLVDIMSLIG